MTKKYTVREGFTFRDDDGKIVAGGEVIELADDVAEQHMHKLDPLKESAEDSKSTPQPGSTVLANGAVSAASVASLDQVGAGTVPTGDSVSADAAGSVTRDQLGSGTTVQADHADSAGEAGLVLSDQPGNTAQAEDEAADAEAPQ